MSLLGKQPIKINGKLLREKGSHISSSVWRISASGLFKSQIRINFWNYKSFRYSVRLHRKAATCIGLTHPHKKVHTSNQARSGIRSYVFNVQAAGNNTLPSTAAIITDKYIWKLFVSLHRIQPWLEQYTRKNKTKEIYNKLWFRSSIFRT
jgi:hypothetical protein